jgi:glucose/arabinose dehydrogenase
MRIASTSLCVLLLVAGCGDDDDPGGTPDGGGPADGGGVDAGPDVDSGPTPDDAGPMVDAGPPPTCEAPTIPMLATEPVADGVDFERPIFVVQAPGSSDTLWVGEQGGRIRLVRGGAVVGDFMDLSVDRSGNERGLLGMAFHPDYASNGRFFLFYNPNASRDVVGEFRVSGDPDVADPAEARRLVDTDTLESNHNGGALAFGPDGFLYAGMGDGGGGGDRGHGPIGNGLNTDVPLGKILRLDVDNEAGGFAAAGNPFEGGGGLPTIWAYGLRNPWRFSFDRRTGDLYIGDVGQGVWEEIDIQPASSGGGENYGWRAYEGFEVFEAADVDQVPVHAEPVLVVRHSSDPIQRDACSITGGVVYRGPDIPDLRGVYLFGDYCSGDIAAFRWCDGAIQGSAERVPGLRGRGVVSFGEDNAGNIYLVNFQADGAGNKVFRIIEG